MFFQNFGQFPRVVSAPGEEMEQGKICRLKGFVHKFVTYLPVGTIVTGIVQFNAQDGVHRLRITEQKAQVLLDDATAIALIFVGASYKKDVGQANFRTNDRPVARHVAEDMIERELRGRKEVIVDTIGKIIERNCGFFRGQGFFSYCGRDSPRFFLLS